MKRAVFYCIALAVCWILLVSPARGQVFVLAASGSCVEQMTVAFAGGSPSGMVEFYRGTFGGEGTAPVGACAGTALDLGQPELLSEVSADASGGFSLSISPPPGSCGTAIQAVDLTTCTTTNAARLSTGAPAAIGRSGQTVSYAANDDGDLKPGVAWPDPRFTDNADGTVTDNLTGLRWLRDATCFGLENWDDALASAAGLVDGQCGLTDGSAAGDWRMPSLRELLSLLDYSEFSPALPAGHPFSQVDLYYYWSSTTYPTIDVMAWNVNIEHPLIVVDFKAVHGFAWPVRGGE